MEYKNPLILSRERPFVAGTSNLAVFHRRLYKLDCMIIIFCHSGWGQVLIDLERHEIIRNTQMILLPGTVISLAGQSNDFRVSYFAAHSDMFREACLRLEPSFFHFLKENPVVTLPAERTRTINGLIIALPDEFTANINRLLEATISLYADKDHNFRYQIARNHLQSFLLDVYDKVHRFFTRDDMEGHNRQDELFKKFIALIHENCLTEREVSFYADRLCISTKYLTGICRSITNGASAKQIIDQHVILEIKVLLQSTELSMQEIADRLGFPDQSYLGRYFKRYEGRLPENSRYITTNRPVNEVSIRESNNPK